MPIFLSKKASPARVREAENARKNRLEILKALSTGQITRRDLYKWGIFTVTGALALKNGLSPFAPSAFADSSIPTGTPRSPLFGARKFSQPMPRLWPGGSARELDVRLEMRAEFRNGRGPWRVQHLAGKIGAHGGPPCAYQDAWHRSACPRCRQAVAPVRFEDSTRLRTHDDAWQRCRRQLRIVSDPGVPPVKDVITPADDLMPLRAPSSRYPRALLSGVCNH